MELKPTTKDVQQRDAYDQQRAEAAEQAAHIAAEKAKANEQAQKIAEANQQRAEHYRATLNLLREVAVPQNPREFTDEHSHCLAAHATDWVLFGVDDGSKLSTECRYLSKDIVTTHRDHSQQAVIMRSFVEVIEVHHRDDAIDYTSKPGIVALLHDDDVTVMTEAGRWSYRFAIGGEDGRSEVEDFITTVLEPIAARGAKATPNPDQGALY